MCKIMEDMRNEVQKAELKSAREIAKRMRKLLLEELKEFEIKVMQL